MPEHLTVAVAKSLERTHLDPLVFQHAGHCRQHDHSRHHKAQQRKKIAELAEQYIDYLKKMEELNMDIASEFIVMASELLYIKSKMLLPKENSDSLSEEEDPRQKLVEKLLDYRKYAEISGYLKEREQIGINSHTKNREKIKGLIKYSKINMDKENLISTLDLLYERLEERIVPSKEAFSEIVEREIVSVSSMLCLWNLSCCYLFLFLFLLSHFFYFLFNISYVVYKDH